MKKLIALLIVVMSIFLINGCGNKSVDMEIASDPIAQQLERERNHAENRMDNLKGRDGREDDLQEARKEWLSATHRYYARCKEIREKHK